MNEIYSEIQYIYDNLTHREKESLCDKEIFITGFAGSLGYLLCMFFLEKAKELQIKKVYCLDTYIFGKPSWVGILEESPLFSIKQGCVVDGDFSFAQSADYIFHMASLASPIYYRLHPIETMDADVQGLRNLLDFYKDKGISNLLFYSTSEIYGDPDPSMIPTPESYWGNVNTSGPRACYDESKRFGETLCYNYAQQYHFPVTVVRPFNSYGPGLRTNDKRVVADFAENIFKQEDIVIYSDGKATRTFCYIQDTTLATLKALLYGSYDIFNVGNDDQELTISELAEIYKKIGEESFGYSGNIVYKTHQDPHYTTDNPKRRCPDLSKAKKLLAYEPSMTVEAGVARYLHFIKNTNALEGYKL